MTEASVWHARRSDGRALWLVALAVWAGVAGATTVDGTGALADALEHSSELLLVSVAEAQPTVLGQGEDEVPVVEYSLIVLEALDGVRVTGSQLTFRVPGGPYHGGHVTVPGAPRITVGDELLVTVEAIEGSTAHFTPRWEGGLFVRGTRADGATVALDHRREAVVDASCELGPLRAFDASRAPLLTGQADTDDAAATAVAEVSAPAGPVFTERPREVAMPWSDLLDEARLCAQTVRGEVAP